MCSKDTKGFWKAWRKRFCLNKLKPAQTVNGKVGDKEIVNEFSSFFSSIGKPNTANLDELFAGHVSRLLKDDKHLKTAVWDILQFSGVSHS